jgi:hypothetical protein
MTGYLLEKGKRDREHRDTGRQRSEPEEGRHAGQPEGPTGERRKPPAEMVWGVGNDQDWGATGIGGVYKAIAFIAGERRMASRLPVR